MESTNLTVNNIRTSPSGGLRTGYSRRRGAAILIASAFVMILCLNSASAQCRSPLDGQTISALTFNTFYSSFQLRPGETLDLNLGTVWCCYGFFGVDACAVWSVDDSLSAHIDAQTGVLTIEPAALPGTKLTVTADIENGRRILTIPVFIYTPETHPLVGVWSESARFSCNSGEQVPGSEPIRELVFRADGTMYVTRFVFELYRDYVATYEFNLERRKVSFSVQFANALPAKIDAAGRFKIVEGELVLKALSLGSFAGEKKACRYEFQRVGTEH